MLLLEREKQRGHRVGSQYLGMLLHDHESLRVAVLNACEGARTSKQDPFAGSAQTLVQQGIPAVIAMQFEIADDVAQHVRARALRRAGRRLSDRRRGHGGAKGDLRDGPGSRVGDAGALPAGAGRPDLRHRQRRRAAVDRPAAAVDRVASESRVPLASLATVVHDPPSRSSHRRPTSRRNDDAEPSTLLRAAGRALATGDFADRARAAATGAGPRPVRSGARGSDGEGRGAARRGRDPGAARAPSSASISTPRRRC